MSDPLPTVRLAPYASGTAPRMESLTVVAVAADDWVTVRDPSGRLHYGRTIDFIAEIGAAPRLTQVLGFYRRRLPVTVTL